MEYSMSKLIDLMNRKQELEIELDENITQQEKLEDELSQVKNEIKQEKANNI